MLIQSLSTLVLVFSLDLSITKNLPLPFNFLSGLSEVKSSSVKSGPSGYYYQGVWRALGGTTIRQFNNSTISQCLKGKEVHMYGDSTIRQWFEYLNAALPGN